MKIGDFAIGSKLSGYRVRIYLPLTYQEPAYIWQVTYKPVSLMYPDIFTPCYGDNAAAGRHAEVNGIRIYYETYGQGVPLLLLHGALQSIAAMSPQITELSKYYQVIAVDTRGHGHSTVDATRLTYELYADDMAALLRQLCAEPAYVLGWSDGAITGLLLAMAYPGQVKKLVVMAANLYSDHTSIEAWSKDIVRNRLALLKDKVHKTERDLFAIRVNECLLTEPHIAPEALRAINCATLVMAGGEDVIKQTHTELIARHITGSQLVIFKGISHMAPVEIPEVFNHTVLQFLEDNA